MKTLLKNGKVINVFTGEIEDKNVLMEGDRIIGVGDYDEADVIEDVSGKYICPSFIDCHIHIESTTLLPWELAKVCVPHGTGAIVADPHEIANVCGTAGISFMLESSQNLPMKMYFMLPSCVPAMPLDESGAVLNAEDLEQFYGNERVLGLAEMMNYPGVINGDSAVAAKIEQAKAHNTVINGHAPLLSGRDLDNYIAHGIQDDHECATFEEAAEKLRKGQWIMVRQGTSARNLEKLIDLFEPPYNHRCVLVTDDKQANDLLTNGHIDYIIRRAVELGKSAVTGIQMATIQAAQCYGLRYEGAVAPGYRANVLVLDDLDTVAVRDVYYNGECVCRSGKLVNEVMRPDVDEELTRSVYRSFNMDALTAKDFYIEPKGNKCRVIRNIPGEVITDEVERTVDFADANVIDVDQDIVKIAVCERHNRTGHIGIGLIEGLGIRRGAFASSVSHDSHNLIVVGANEADMALAGNTVREMGGGLCAVLDGKVIGSMPLPVAGLMSDKDAETVSEENRAVRESVKQLGVLEGVEPFMCTSFLSLTVIPNVKMSTRGIVDVLKQEVVSLFK